MRAISRISMAVASMAILATSVAAQSGSSSAGGVATVDQAVDRIIAREHDQVAVIRQYSPIVETYVQDMKPDAELGIVPVRDHYYLGQAELSKGLVDDSMLQKKKSKAAEFNPFAHLEGSSSYIPEGFLQMVYIDSTGFDRQHYEFTYVGREFLGEVRCAVFDVAPLPKSGKGRFYGRIWAEDQGFAIVRFNGMYSSAASEGSGFNLHFDSWRMNLQPDLWLPAFVYSQESEIKTSTGAAIRFKAQTRLWGYNLAGLNRPVDFNSTTVASPVSSDQAGAAGDYSPIQSEREWQERAEINVLDRLQRIGLLAPPGEVDKILETVVNNLEVTNNLDVDVHCRILLTSTLESFSIGHTIVISRGLLDVLPDEASLATALSQELASIIITKPSTDQWGFNDTTNVSAADVLARFSFKATPADINMANQKAFEILKGSPYKDKLSSAALFYKQLTTESSALPSLIDARLGNGVSFSAQLASLSPPLQADKLDQVAALPLGARVKLNPWDDHVELLKAKPVALNSAREKMPFEVTPFLLFLTRYHSTAPSDKANASTVSGKQPSHP